MLCCATTTPKITISKKALFARRCAYGWTEFLFAADCADEHGDGDDWEVDRAWAAGRDKVKERHEEENTAFDKNTASFQDLLTQKNTTFSTRNGPASSQNATI